MRKYTPSEIEAKWQKVWADTKLYEVTEDPNKEKIYCTPMLPYPSGAGLHVGHVRNYSISDTLARFYRQRGYNTMTNIGWDSFGLPAENYAIKTGTPPAESTATNIKNFKNQAQRLGLSFDWSREINTSDPGYYKWTQWVFTQLFRDDLAYSKESMVWWDPVDKTVLANEQVIDGKADRSGAVVERKALQQWFLRITRYADPLLDELDNLDWPEHILTQQRNWIGRSSGAEIDFAVDGSKDKIRIFTTRPDTIYGATFMVLAPENPLLENITSDDCADDVSSYVQESIKKTDIDRMDEGKEKTGVFTGAYAINPANKEKIPIWVSDFVLGSYGTGAIMAVPAHDQRDFEFAKKFDLQIKQVWMEAGDDPVNPPRDGFKLVERETVVVHLKDKKSGKYALLNWHGSLEGITTAIMGGIDDGETAEEAALKEIAEEAGLKDNVKIVKTARWVSAATYCASHKNENRKSISTAMYAEVDGLEDQKEVDEHEKKTHTLIWVNEDEVEDRLTPVNQKHIWGYLQEDAALLGEGEIINSGKYDGLTTFEARDRIVADLAKQGVAEEKINYRLRDWLISRQRYWGAPIPIVWVPADTKLSGAVSELAGDTHVTRERDGRTERAVAVPEKYLPVELPEVDSYAPDDSGLSPLGRQRDWVEIWFNASSGESRPRSEKQPGKQWVSAVRDTDTMDGYVCSSWYIMRYCDPNNELMAWDPDKVNYWFPMDFYLGGDHAVAHLLYFRFWTHYFAENGLLEAHKKEPVRTLVYNGYINAEDGRKMSKSLGNVVDPLDIIDNGYGADALRMYELFVGPYDQDVAWNPNGVPGTYRFLQRVWGLTQEFLDSEDFGGKPDPEKSVVLARITQKTVKKVTSDLEGRRFNTAIAACMEFVNSLNKLKIELPMQEAYAEWKETITQLLLLLAPFAPHMTEELWEEMGHDTSIHVSAWPTWDDALLVDDTKTIVVQVNGKVRANLEVVADAPEADIEALARKDENVQRFIADKKLVKSIYVKDKLINLVVK